jgi:hypothetical protein
MKAKNPRNAIFTSCNAQYLDRAMVLLESIRLHEPDVAAVILYVDEISNLSPKQIEHLHHFDLVLTASELIGVNFDSWVFSRNVIEACTAIKPVGLIEILNRGFKKVVYLDPDVCLYRKLDPVWNELDRSPICLTPHRLTGVIKSNYSFECELSAYRYGVFNLGFLAVSNGSEAMDLAKWWNDRQNRGYKSHYDIPFTDQQWFDVIPVTFPCLAVIRQFGMNVASWNIDERNVIFGPEGSLTVNGEELYFAHFSKLGSKGLNELTRSGNFTTAFAGLTKNYFNAIDKYRKYLGELPKWEYAEWCFGGEITDAERVKFRTSISLTKRFKSPSNSKKLKEILETGY